MKKHHVRGKTALITGASSGIGYELAQLFATDGYDLVLVAKNEPQLFRIADELATTFEVSVTPLGQDLTEAQAVDQIFARLQQDAITVDVLVNNAGIGIHGAFAQIDLAKELELVQVNIVAITALTKVFLQEMLKRGQGKILNVASTAAFESGPFVAVYFATKAYVLSFSEALAEELRGTGITVTTLCPGPTHTNFLKQAGVQKIEVLRHVTMRPSRVAMLGYRGLMAGKLRVVPGLVNELFLLAVKFAPRRWSTWFVGVLQRTRMRSGSRSQQVDGPFQIVVMDKEV
jgi:short-subunit dehydrogenase